MATTILLHGGPWHGQATVIEDGKDHFHISQPLPGQSFSMMTDEESEYAPIRRREGMYSRCHGDKLNFEWDGWRSHD